jgi:hypothetical protein
MLMIALALTTAHIYPLIELPTLHAEPITYTKTATTTSESLEAKIERKTLEIYKVLEPINLEKARQEALREISDELMLMTYNSPYIDYDTMSAKYPQ